MLTPDVDQLIDLARPGHFSIDGQRNSFCRSLGPLSSPEFLVLSRQQRYIKDVQACAEMVNGDSYDSSESIIACYMEVSSA